MAGERKAGKNPPCHAHPGLAVDDPLVEAAWAVRLERSGPGSVAFPGVVGLQFPAHDVVGEKEIEDGVDPLLVFWVLDRDEHLDAAVEIAWHQVGGADEVQRFRSSTSPVVEA